MQIWTLIQHTSTVRQIYKHTTYYTMQIWQLIQHISSPQVHINHPSGSDRCPVKFEKCRLGGNVIQMIP